MHRFTNAKGIELIKQFEGLRSEPYICAGGYLVSERKDLNKRV